MNVYFCEVNEYMNMPHSNRATEDENLPGDASVCVCVWGGGGGGMCVRACVCV